MIKPTPSVTLGIYQQDLKNPNWVLNSKSKKLVSAKSGKSFISLKKFPYPKLFSNLNSASFGVGYDFGDDEKFSIAVKKGKLEIITPNFGQLHLFYIQKEDWFFAADSFGALVGIAKAQIDFELDPLGVANLLYFEFNLEEVMIFKDVKLLSENRKLILKNKKISVSHNLELVDLVLPYALSKDDNKFKKFEEHFNNDLEKIKNIGGFNRWGSCLSGGTDSGITSILASETLPTDTYTILVNDEPEIDRQRSVNKKILSKLQSSNKEYNSAKIPLFKDWDDIIVADPYLDIYANWSRSMAEDMLKKNTDLILTGMGADEYFKKKINPKNFQPKFGEESEFNQLFTKEFKNLSVINFKKRREKRFSPVSEGLSSSLVSYNTTWRIYDIWPVTPYISKSLISFSLYLNEADLIIKEFLKDFARKKVDYDFPEWQTKIFLGGVAKSMLLRELKKFKMSDIDRRLENLAVLNIEEVEEVIKKYNDNPKKHDLYTGFLIIFLKLNRFLKLFDQM